MFVLLIKRNFNLIDDGQIVDYCVFAAAVFVNSHDSFFT